MLKINRLLLLLLLNFICILGSELEKSLVVGICSYNNQDWFEQNLNSVFSQNYKNFRIIYIDDCSTDGTGDLVENYLKERNLEDKVTLIKNKIRRTALANQYTIIHLCHDDEIVVTLDGDDWFAHDNVFNKVNEIYKDPNIWMSYGTKMDIPGNIVPYFITEIDESRCTRGYREYPFIFDHLRTYYAWLAKKIKLKDLILSTPMARQKLINYWYDAQPGKGSAMPENLYLEGLRNSNAYIGNFFPSSADNIIMIPMAEMAHKKIKYVREILYHRNVYSSLNDHKVSRGLQLYCGTYIRTYPVYKQLIARPPKKTHRLVTDIIVFGKNAINILKTLQMLQEQFLSLGNIYIMGSKSHNRLKEKISNTKINIIDQSPTAETLNKIFSELSDYIVLIDTDNLTSSRTTVDLADCVSLLEQTGAYLFYLGDIQGEKPLIYASLNDKINFWQFGLNQNTWNNPNSLNCILIHKAKIKRSLRSCRNQTKIDLQKLKKNLLPVARDLGLFYNR